MPKVTFPRVMFAAPFSNAGKTTVTLSVLAALVARGNTVQAYKCGPDYIDTSFHEYATGHAAANLDTFLTPAVQIPAVLADDARENELAVLEGAMGLFDGLGSTSEHSSAEIAALTKTPVILVIPAKGIAASSLPIIEGFANFDERVEIKGVIFSDVASESYAKLLKEVMLDAGKIKYLGYMKHDESITIPSRHLGLVPHCELEGFATTLQVMQKSAEETLDIEGILDIAKGAPELEYEENQNKVKPLDPSQRPPVIGIVRDQAFNFYYRSSLQALIDAGAILHEFSLLEEDELPADLDGLYIGGGYPEMFADLIDENRSMADSMYMAMRMGLPTYAEAGGFMYLQQSIVDEKGDTYEATGIYYGQVHMDVRKADHFGYVEMAVPEPNFLFKPGVTYRAHEFHHAIIYGEGTNFRFKKASTKQKWKGGGHRGNMIGSFAHLDFSAYPHLAENFVKAASQYHTAKPTAEETRGRKSCG
ncbi:MAG: cobyrinate a,c-diamide synthase [Coriobacteriia bacterium]|nr:cobyrinate a,c-diamide synthase [Coriobacteriia bacterium]